jgi:hypothetical protein
MDVPDWVLDLDQAPVKDDDGCEESNELARHWKVYEGVEDVMYHLSSVAAGMASRPRRPDRDTLFLPFSSRDAHVWLQLKRTKEVAMERRVKNQLLEYALRSGKVARNPQFVPDHLHLHEEYGTAGGNPNIRPSRPENCPSEWL